MLRRRVCLSLVYDKKQALEVDLKNFFDAYDKIKHIAVNYTEGMNELSSFKLDEQDEIEIRKLTDIYSSSIKSGATGAAAGAVIALAASGTLPIVTGGLDIAGSMFMAGEFSAAAGIAGSALSFWCSYDTACSYSCASCFIYRNICQYKS